MSVKANKQRACQSSQIRQIQVSCNGIAAAPYKALNNNKKEHNNLVSLAGSMVLQVYVQLDRSCLLPAGCG